MLNDQIGVAEAKYAEELRCLATLLVVWLLRDNRIVVSARARSDAKRSTQRLNKLLDGLAESLAFQLRDSTYPAASPGPAPVPVPVGEEHGLPLGADCDLVLEARAAGARTFVTRDRPVLRQTMLTGPPIQICATSDLAHEPVTSRVAPMAGGLCHGQGYPYRNTITLAPDWWGPLFAHFEDE
jgi:hypothetical protein